LTPEWMLLFGSNPPCSYCRQGSSFRGYSVQARAALTNRNSRVSKS
jgi:hypothetical protein